MFASNFSARGVLALALALSAYVASAQTVTQGGQAAPAVGAPAVVQPTVAPPVPARPIVMRESAAATAIANINERMSVKEAELAELELDARIKAKRAEIDGLNQGPVAPSGDGFTPTVLEISGVDGRLGATLVVQGGNVQRVKKGDVVGGWVVGSISVDALTLVRGKETKHLSFGSSVVPMSGPVLSGQAGQAAAMPRQP